MDEASLSRMTLWSVLGAGIILTLVLLMPYCTGLSRTSSYDETLRESSAIRGITRSTPAAAVAPRGSTASPGSAVHEPLKEIEDLLRE